jgi:hypothetical protein
VTEDERVWESWKSENRLTEIDREILAETERLREEAERIEQRVSRPANRVSP